MNSFDRRAFLRRLAATGGSMALVGCGGGGSDTSGVVPDDPSSGPPIVDPPQSGNPPPPPGTTVAMRFGLSSPAAIAMAPFCLGYAFRKGDVPAAQDVVADLPNLQVTPKNRWPDGSLKFAIVAGHATLAANQTLVVTLSAGTTGARAALATSDLTAAGVMASVGCGSFGTATWSSADWARPFQNWVSGPEMSSWIYRKPVGADAHLVAWLELRLFAGGAIEVLPWIENGYLRVPGPTNKSATYSFSLGGTARFNDAIDLPNHCRTPLVDGVSLSHWLGKDPQVTPTHDTAYLQQTSLVPAYRASVASSARAVEDLPISYTPLQQGSYPASMGTAGYHGSIGLLPEWDVLYLTSIGSPVHGAVVRNAYSAGRYGIHFRDESTQRPLKFSSYPNLVVGGGSGIRSSGASSKNTYTPDATGTAPPNWASSHHPSVGFMAYLVTGRWYFVEEVQFAATLNYLKNSDQVREFAGGVFQTSAGANTTRGAAWAIRTLAQAACITPDEDTVLRSEFLTSLQANVDWNHARYVAQPNNPFGWVQPYSDYTAGAGDNVYFDAAWMKDFFTAAYGYAKAMELAITAPGAIQLTEFFAWNARSIIGRLGGVDSTDYLYADAAQYTIAVAPTDSPDFVNGSGPWFANWGEIYAATLKSANPGVEAPLRGGNFPSATSYWGNLQPAIAYAVQHGVQGAVESYRRMTSAGDWSQLVAGFNESAVWSVRPPAEP